MEMNQSSSTETVGQSAPAETPQASPEAAAPQVSTDVSRPTNDASTAPAKEGVQSGQPSKNWEREYQQLRSTLGIEKDSDVMSYKNLRLLSQRQGAEKNMTAKELTELKQTVKALTEDFRKVTAAPYDHDQFMEGWKQGGIEFLFKHLKEPLQKETEPLRSELQETRQQLQAMVVEHEYAKRLADTVNYPGFKEREPTMAEIFQNSVEAFEQGRTPVDPRTMKIKDLYDELYTLAGPLHSQEALKKAEAHGAAAKEAELANEAHTSVATGGKHTAPRAADTSNMSWEQLREMLPKARPQ